jgi:glycosyltransferase involved in cell wall biosynthesis
MKILLVHNFYGSSAPSGENTVYLAERELLRQNGHRVLEFTRQSDEIRARGAAGLAAGACSAPWNPFSAAGIRRMLQREQPDVMHVHNTFPLISPSLFHAARSFPVATVLTLHNYRLFCAAGIPERGGVPCTDCLDRRSALPALRHGCYRQSRLATLPMAAMIALHRRLGTWRSCVDAFIALTSFQQQTMAGAGLPARRIAVKPHFYADPPPPVPWSRREQKAVYVGRLGDYKGVHILVEAWKRWGKSAPWLEIIGEGPERARLEAMALGAPITFSGQLGFGQVQERLARARLLLLPSLCFEGFPMVIREAFALGVPVAGSRLGSIPCIVDQGTSGVLFAPGEPEDLLGAVRGLWQEPARLEAMGEGARREFSLKYGAEANHRLLLDIYRQAMETRARGVKAG